MLGRIDLQREKTINKKDYGFRERVANHDHNNHHRAAAAGQNFFTQQLSFRLQGRQIIDTLFDTYPRVFCIISV